MTLRSQIAVFPLAVLLIFVTSAAALAGGTVEGRVTLPARRTAPVATKRYEVVAKGGVLATDPPLGVVYVEGSGGRKSAPEVKRVAQKDLAFLPALLAVQTGTKVEFPNEDDTYHNIFSYSQAKRFDLGRYRKDEHPTPSVVFENPGLVTLRCDIHEHMRGLILVLDTPHFVITDSEGGFRLTNLPAGKFTLKAWVDSRTTKAQPLEIKDGTTTHVDFP